MSIAPVTLAAAGFFCFWGQAGLNNAWLCSPRQSRGSSLDFALASGKEAPLGMTDLFGVRQTKTNVRQSERSERSVRAKSRTELR